MQLCVYKSSLLDTALGGAAVAQEASGQYVQVAEIEVDPAQMDAYRVAVQSRTSSLAVSRSTSISGKLLKN